MNLLHKIYRNYNTSVARKRTRIEESEYWQAAVRNIAPVTLEEHKSGKYVVINGDTVAECCIIGVPRDTINGYPQGLSDSLVSRLIGLSTYGVRVAYSFKLIPVDPSEATTMIQQSVFLNRMNQEESRKRNVHGMVNLDLQIDQEHNVSNYRSIMENKDRLFHSAFIITIWADDEDGLNELEADIRTILESELVQYEFPRYRQLETFIAAQPFNTTADYAQVEILSPYAAVLTSSHNPNSRTDQTGLYVGKDKITSRPIIVDIDKLAAQHLLGVGATGSGKTFTLLLLLMRARSLLDRRVIYLTPKADEGTNHRAVVDYYKDDAELIDIGPNGHNINPLQILFDKAQMKGDVNEYIHAYNTHKGILYKFFDVWFEGTGSINMTNFLDYSLNKVYESKGIRRDVPQTWDNANWPVMADLIKFWKNELHLADPEDKKTIKAMINKTFSLSADGALAYMNRTTDIDLSKDFIVIDLSNVPEMVRDAMNVLVTGILGQRFRTDAKKSTIIAVDEARVFLHNPELSKFLMTALTQGRSHSIALWLLTQQATDLTKAGTAEEFQTNIFLKMVLGNNMTKSNVKHVAEYFGFGEYENDLLQSCTVGEGLFMIGDNVIPVEFTPTKLETNIIKGKTEIQAEQTESMSINPALLQLVLDHGFCLSVWVDGEFSMQGYSRHQVSNVFGSGTKTTWIKDDLFRTDGLVLNQSIDHYATVMQIAGELILQGYDNVTVNHTDDVDISYVCDGKDVALEYEREGSHNEKELIDKKTRYGKLYDELYFICSASYEKKLIGAVGDGFVIRRGEILKNHIFSKTS